MDKKTNILIVVVLVLALTVVYMIATKNVVSKTSPVVKEDFMKAHIPTDLTDQQKAELKAGAASHSTANLTFDISGGSFFYTPNEIKVRQGDKVKIIFTNVGGMHNLTFDDFGGIATKTVNTGETDTIEFTASKKGTFEFYCSVGAGYHRMKGQIGVLIVE